MKVTTETLDTCEVLMTVEIDDEQKEKLLQKAARRISKQVKIPGFRPGKAPYNFILNRFGLEALQEEAMEDLTESVFQSAIKEAGITPYALASLDSIEWSPLVMKVKVPLEPEVELGDYRAISLEVEEAAVTAEEVEHQLEHLRDHYATYSPVDRPAQMGDMVSVTISEKDLASGEFLAQDHHSDIVLTEPEPDSADIDFAASLLGLSAGESTSFTHTYDASDSDEEYAGKEIEFSITVDQVKVKEEAELNDEFASQAGDFDTLDALKQAIEADLKAQKQRAIDDDIIEKMLNRVVEEAKTIKWPPVLEERELDNAVSNREYRFRQAGLDLATHLQTQQKTLETFREELRDGVKAGLKTSLALGKIVELEELTVDEMELNRQADMMVMFSGGGKQAANTFKSPPGLRVLANNMLTDKAHRRLLAIAKGEADLKAAEPENTPPANKQTEDAPPANAETSAETPASTQAETA